MHVHAIDRVARSYEHIDPEAVGNFRRVLVSDMSGRTNILMKAQELGFKLKPDTPEVKAITARSRNWKTRATNSKPPKARWRCSSARRSSIANRRFTWTPTTSPCAATARNPSAKPP